MLREYKRKENCNGGRNGPKDGCFKRNVSIGLHRRSSFQRWFEAVD
ncbi:MAG: hypothetical protein PHU42_04630 [Patescibacteria group bacterium]|nr:hypothetical protein [Patescibacteria group bacterium]